MMPAAHRPDDTIVRGDVRLPILLSVYTKVSYRQGMFRFRCSHNIEFILTRDLLPICESFFAMTVFRDL